MSNQDSPSKRPLEAAGSSQKRLAGFELQIGRKVLGWAAVVLFVLGSAFFIQLAIAHGWLNPFIRFSAMTLLALGGYFFRRGWRRYSGMLNSAGIVTFLSTGYYVHYAAIFPQRVSTAILLCCAFGGLLYCRHFIFSTSFPGRLRGPGYF